MWVVIPEVQTVTKCHAQAPGSATVPTAAALTCSRALVGFSAEASGTAVGQGQGAAGRYTAADYHRAYASGAVTPLQVPVLAAALSP